ncbi:MAG: acetyltransferase [Gammaproteobacteria bacterium]|nr:acetyltransferase [Gammaproteobacteria bacterium]MBU1408496.1 acetyltransferase [Gammaproteobacteria bacterium]MBU1532308.1 acetyltransferase [Gammaproteobacteria bacterium]
MNAQTGERLVIFGISNILSDLLDCALALKLPVSKVVIHHPENPGERDLSVANRIEAYSHFAKQPILQEIDAFSPEDGERYLLGPTSPERRGLAEILVARFGLTFTSLVHPSAYVSPMAQLSGGVFVGANSVIAPGVELAEHVFVNRGVTIGHDTRIGAYSRVQPGSNLGGLSHIGEGVTIGIGATLLERLQIGDRSVIAAGSVVLRDVPEDVLVAGIPAAVKKQLTS